MDRIMNGAIGEPTGAGAVVAFPIDVGLQFQQNTGGRLEHSEFTRWMEGRPCRRADGGPSQLAWSRGYQTEASREPR